MSGAKHGRGPVRTCVGCGSRDSAASLIRLVRQQDGALVVDRRGGKPGRGAHLHRAEDCWSQFARKRGVVRSFRAAVQPQTRAALVVVLRGMDC